MKKYYFLLLMTINPLSVGANDKQVITTAKNILYGMSIWNVLGGVGSFVKGAHYEWNAHKILTAFFTSGKHNHVSATLSAYDLHRANAILNFVKGSMRFGLVALCLDTAKKLNALLKKQKY